MKLYLVLLLIATVFMISCKTNQNQSTNNVNEIQVSPTATFFELSGLGGKWTLEYISPVDGKDIKQLYKIQMPYLNFVDENKVAGNNGCNNISGGYSISSDHSIRFDTDKFGATRMFCEGLDEKAFLNALKSVNKFDIIKDENKLLLITGGVVTMSFVKAKE